MMMMVEVVVVVVMVNYINLRRIWQSRISRTNWRSLLTSSRANNYWFYLTMSSLVECWMLTCIASVSSCVSSVSVALAWGTGKGGLAYRSLCWSLKIRVCWKKLESWYGQATDCAENKPKSVWKIFNVLSCLKRAKVFQKNRMFSVLMFFIFN